MLLSYFYSNHRVIPHMIHAGLSAILFSACGASPQSQETKGPIEVSLSKTEQAFDINNDGPSDVWRKYVQKGNIKILASKSFDLNFDQKVDFQRFYDEKGKVLRDEMDMDFDGKTDCIVYYKNNVIDRKEIIIPGSETVKVFSYYKDGQLNTLEGDSDGDGVLDYFQFYKDGKMVRRGFDLDGNGVPDKFEHIDE